MKRCEFFVRGRCSFGPACKNLHDKRNEGKVGNKSTSTRKKESEIEEELRETQRSIEALNLHNSSFKNLQSIPDSEDFSAYIRFAVFYLFIRQDLLCTTTTSSEMFGFKFLFRKQSDLSYLILDHHDCGRVIGYDGEKNKIMSVFPFDPRCISWIVEISGQKIRIKHPILNSYWRVKPHATGRTSGSIVLDLKRDSSSAFSFVESFEVKKEKIPIMNNIKLLPLLPRGSQKKHDVCINRSDKDADMYVELGRIEVYGSIYTRTWVQARATHGLRGKGKFYYEGKQLSHSYCRLGWSVSGAKTLGKDSYGFGYGGTGIYNLLLVSKIWIIIFFRCLFYSMVS